jgi:hypothetical protein
MVRKRDIEISNCPTQAKGGLEWATGSFQQKHFDGAAMTTGVISACFLYNLRRTPSHPKRSTQF